MPLTVSLWGAIFIENTMKPDMGEPRDFWGKAEVRKVILIFAISAGYPPDLI